MLTFFSLALMLARKLPTESRLSKGAYLFPLIAVLIAVLDIIPSLILLLSTGNLPDIANWVVMCISGGYVLRVLLLYALLLWMLVTGVSLLLARFRKSDPQVEKDAV